jgi:hypothetical protein
MYRILFGSRALKDLHALKAAREENKNEPFYTVEETKKDLGLD